MALSRSRGRVLAECFALVIASQAFPINTLSDSAINLLVWVAEVWEQRETQGFLVWFGLIAKRALFA